MIGQTLSHFRITVYRPEDTKLGREVAIKVLLGVALALLAAVAGCARQPVESTEETLTQGLWHASVGSEDVLFELTFRDGSYGGRLHRVIDGRQTAELTVAEVLLDGRSIEISLAPFPSYRGQLDPIARRIEGGISEMPVYADMDLSRVERAHWPMVGILPPGEAATRWSQPVDRGDGWPTGTPGEADIDQGAVEALLGAIADGDAGAMHSLLIARDGKLIVEQYFHGWGPDDLHRIASVTKSVSSLLIGVAVDGGHLPGVDASLVDFFPDRRALAGSGWETLRLEHLLTMSMGLDWSDAEAASYARAGEDWFTAVLERNVATEPGTLWRYVSRNTQLLSGIVHRSTGLHADEFAARHLFAPLGITVWDWDENRFGDHPSMSGTLRLRPRDMAKLGQLMLSQGAWDGRRVVSAEWVSRSTRGHIGDPAGGEQYGYLWRRLDEPGPDGTLLASGIGSQFIAIVPSLDLVLVTTGANELNGLHPAFLGVATEHLLPGVRSQL